ncbi:scavenger receptor cysteine-rich type 1 protein M130-like [Perca fluviatilis]|uniref:scavenger receptor cysteine-rich type 1 protein M130-like n=1 Tax=Perca fluviatilis TaxID=8168 RepID=UPI0019649CD4|nr:scavenger receptor cysteine-rich type 1 protein M130-like [Perca fluviatilis]
MFITVSAAATAYGLQAEGKHNSTETVRLVGGDSRCAGSLELKHQGDWKQVSDTHWNLKKAAVACKELDCGSAVSVGWREESSDRSVWKLKYDCVQSGSALRECARSDSSSTIVDLNCSESVRLVNGTSLCSGRLEVKTNKSPQRWSSVCEDDFDHQDAEVVCRELGCGAPSVLQGVHYGEVEAPMWTKEFQCGGQESALLDCGSSGSERNVTCSPGKVVGLTCSEPVRLVGGDSRCAGIVELKHLDWRPVINYDITPDTAAAICKELDCGSAVSVDEKEESSYRDMWRVSSDCVQSGTVLRDCVTPWHFHIALNLTCSDLFQPNISVSSSMDGASEAQQQRFRVFRGSTFNVSCSIQPQYPGGSFQLTFTSLNSAHNYTQPAVNHSAHFLFPAAQAVHHGNYSCVYHVSVLSHNFSSESRLLSLTVSDLLFPPNISLDGDSEAQQQGFRVFRGSIFNISCFIQPQYPGGSFQLTFTSTNSAHNYTMPAVNHSAHFLFPAAEPAHQGSYSCVYHVSVLSHNFSSESRLLSLTIIVQRNHACSEVISNPTPLIIRAVILPLTLLLVNAALYLYCKEGRLKRKELIYIQMDF